MPTGRTDSTSTTSRAPGFVPDRGVFINPLMAAVAFSPWLAFHAFVHSIRPTGEAAYEGLRRLLPHPAGIGWWAPACVLALFLLLAQSVTRSPWKIKPSGVVALYVESLLWAAPLLLINRAVLLSVDVLSGYPWAVEVAGRVGAGLYEEFVFRAVLVTGFMVLGTGVLRIGSTKMGVFSILVSAVLFSAYHHLPDFSGMLTSRIFLFRFAAGLYLGAVFWRRGYGPAAGCHMAYNLIIGAA
ncbi:MAG: CPBP family intramembrane metalloprotease [Phycisphaerales bacterium]|nr:CPBP family intramembrane metalloprotease [Phycisphaerales bacterium]